VRAAGLLFTLLVYLAFSGCRASDQVDAGERRAIADSLQALVVRAYDFSKPDVSSRLLSLYADSGRVISAAAGRVHTTRAALASEIAFFWQRVGQNMREPRFDFGSSYVDIVTRDAAVMTFTYRIPHHTPSGTLHVVGGAWTTFWRREGGRWQIVQEHLSDTPESSAPGPSRMDSMPGMVMPIPGTKSNCDYKIRGLAWRKGFRKLAVTFHGIHLRKHLSRLTAYVFKRKVEAVAHPKLDVNVLPGRVVKESGAQFFNISHPALLSFQRASAPALALSRRRSAGRAFDRASPLAQPIWFEEAA